VVNRRQIADSAGSAHDAAPIGVAPVVEDGGVGPGVGVGVGGATAGLLAVVALRVQGPPAGVPALAAVWGPRAADAAPLGGPVAAVVLLGLEEADGIAAAGHQREAQLGEVILPAADGAGLMKARLVLVDQVAATGTGELGVLEHGLGTPDRT